jgi:crotonobetainyl-CoA:carnitine CoA-transferase CaiB-like acyl-CoA transferase
MSKPLEGIRVVEVSMWAFVPSAAAILADWGADVIKIEPPAGDPIRGLTYAGIAPGSHGFTFMWEIVNRGKRSVAIDLAADGAGELLNKLIDSADVFLTNLLPAARRKLGIDVDSVRARNPLIIYGVGSGQGAHGDQAEKGGFDSISFWSRSGIASAVTPADSSYPANMPGAAFGDVTSGAVFAGGIAAAIAHRERTGEASVVDGSLLATALWALQPHLVAARLKGVDELPKAGRAAMPNPLVNTYRTADDRYVSLSMLQQDRFWPGFCKAMDCPELTEDERFVTDQARALHIHEAIAALDTVFARRTLVECQAALATQEGPWDVVRRVGELADDPQVIANGYVQDVDCGDGRSLMMVSSPVQFDRQPGECRPAPDLGAHSDEVLTGLGLRSEELLALRIAGILL